MGTTYLLMRFPGGPYDRPAMRAASQAHQRSSGVTTARAGQKERLIEGMIQVAARHGYGGASVARVVEQAGVSRATFYQHFTNKEACFLAAFDQVAGRVEGNLPLIEAGRPSTSRAGEQLEGPLEDLLASIARSPAAARVVLVEALAGGERVRSAREKFMEALEAALEGWLAVSGEGGSRLEISARAVVEGAGGILLMRLFRGETAKLVDLRDDLVTWVYSYAVPDETPRISQAHWSRLGSRLLGSDRQPPASTPAKRLPRGKSAVAPEAVAGEHRERILMAVAQLARAKGYAAMTVADIVKTGSVTREVFYEIFRSKEDAFLAAQAAGLEASITRAAAGFFTSEDWSARVWDGLEALLAYVAVRPDLVYLDVIESYAAGDASIRRSFDNRMAYTLFLADGYRQTPAAGRLPRLCSEAISNAILGLMRQQAIEGRTEEMLELLPESVYLALTPFIGSEAAIDFVEARASGGTAPLP